MSGRINRAWLVAGGVLGVLVLAGVTAPLWLRPILEGRASAVIGRKVTIGELGIHLLPVRLIAHDVSVAGIADGPPLATMGELAATLDLAPLLQLAAPTFPDISITHLVVEAVETAPGQNNYTLHLTTTAVDPHIGVLRIADSHVHAVLATQDADMTLAVHTEPSSGVGPADGVIIGDLSGTYQKQNITGHVKAGALLELRDVAVPYPVDIAVENGPTRFTMAGTMLDPFHLHGANLKVTLKGQDLATLFPLTGVPFPPTPPYDLSSKVDYDSGVMHLTDLVGRVGSSDLQGKLDVDTQPTRAVLSGAIMSRKVDLEDLAGFIGSQPGRMTTPEQTAAQKAAVARAAANTRLIPNVTMDIAKLRSVDFHIDYRADSIVGKAMPFDSLVARIDIVDGHVKVGDLKAGVGKGQLLGQIDMTPIPEGAAGRQTETMHTVADIRLQRLDLSRLLGADDLVRGAGTLGGTIKLDAHGLSLAEMLARGEGEVSLFMAGGNVSSLVVDLSGLHLGDAVLSAIGIPNRTRMRCFVGDLALAKGLLQTRTVLLNTEADITTLVGHIDVRNETIDARLRTQPKRFTIATLAAPIAVTGRLKSPTFVPEAGEVGARGAGALGLGLLFPPAALLATIQLGVGDDNACVSLVKEGQKK